MEQIKCKSLKKEADAVFTVEAALVIPIVIGVILSVLFMNFRLHDYVVMKAASAEWAAGAGKEENESAFSAALLFYRDVSWERRQEQSTGLISGKTQYYVSYSAADDGFIERLLNGLLGQGAAGAPSGIAGESVSCRRNPVSIIWLCQVFEESENGGEESGDSLQMGEK